MFILELFDRNGKSFDFYAEVKYLPEGSPGGLVNTSWNKKCFAYNCKIPNKFLYLCINMRLGSGKSKRISYWFIII